MALPVISNAQLGAKQTDKHSYYITAASLRSANKNTPADLYHWTEVGRTPIPSFFKVNNTYTYQVGVGYEYKTKRNFTIGINLQYGEIREDYEWNFRFDHFDSAHDLSSVNMRHRYKFTQPYIGLLLPIGYDYNIFSDRKAKLQGRLGLGYMRYLKNNSENLKHTIYYNPSGSDTIFVRDYAETQVYNQDNFALYYNMYLGIGYSINSYPIREIRIGFNFTHAFWFFKHSEEYINRAYALYYDVNGNTVGGDQFSNRFRNFGINVAAVFW